LYTIHPIEVKPLENFKIYLKYEDGTQGHLDLSHLKGKGIFKIWQDYDNFRKVYIDPESHAIAWSEDVDICPDNAYFKIRGIKLEFGKKSDC
jgi:hypothetical protein